MEDQCTPPRKCRGPRCRGDILATILRKKGFAVGPAPMTLRTGRGAQVPPAPFPRRYVHWLQSHRLYIGLLYIPFNPNKGPSIKDVRSKGGCRTKWMTSDGDGGSPSTGRPEKKLVPNFYFLAIIFLFLAFW